MSCFSERISFSVSDFWDSRRFLRIFSAAFFKDSEALAWSLLDGSFWSFNSSCSLAASCTSSSFSLANSWVSSAISCWAFCSSGRLCSASRFWSSDNFSRDWMAISCCCSLISFSSNASNRSMDRAIFCAVGFCSCFCSCSIKFSKAFRSSSHCFSCALVSAWGIFKVCKAFFMASISLRISALISSSASRCTRSVVSFLRWVCLRRSSEAVWVNF